uniref:SprT-like domain-containing protein n=1 Tax=Stomoxys calcitrans TaxID=35570 RepID=A0A1I8NNV2_STOCA
MNEEPVYSLLQAVDPSKIKVPISERFSKLTLSSNKKHKKAQQDREEEDGDNQENLPSADQGKRQSASRNLLEQLSQEMADLLPHRNPLLRSDSSNEQSDEQNDTRLPEIYETMDPLNVTEDESDLDENSPEALPNLDVDALSQKISALDIVAQPISLSSSCSSSVVNINEVTQLVSTESQRSSMGEVKAFKTIVELPVKKVFKKEVISITPNSKIKHCEARNDYEMTEDEDEGDENDSDEVITISDSSVSGGATENQSQAEDPSQMAMSTVHNIKGTLAALSPDKQERLAAFLKDVSIEQRNLLENGRISLDDFEEIDILVKARRIATADTESVTPEGDDEEEDMAIKSLRERQERLKALTNSAEDKVRNDNSKCMASDETQDNSSMEDLKMSPSQQKFGTREDNEKTPQNNRAQRMASAETQNNSEIYDNLETTTNSTEHDMADKNIKQTVRRMASAETEENTIVTEINATKLTEETSPMTPKNYDETPRNQLRRLASAETEENTMMTEMNFKNSFNTPKNGRGNTPRSVIRKMACAKTEDNTLVKEMGLSERPSDSDLHKTPAKNDGKKSLLESPGTSKRIAQYDTEINTCLTATTTPDSRKGLPNLANDETQLNTPESTLPSPDLKHRQMNIAEADTENNDSIVVLSSPEMVNPRRRLETSYDSNSSVYSSSRNNNSAPEHSITILETEDEEEEDRENREPKSSPQSNDNNKLSNSFHNDDKSGDSDDDISDLDEQISQIQLSMANINISAKINIKIHITDSTETSEDGDSSDRQHPRRMTIESAPQEQENSSKDSSDHQQSALEVEEGRLQVNAKTPKGNNRKNTTSQPPGGHSPSAEVSNDGMTSNDNRTPKLTNFAKGKVVKNAASPSPTKSGAIVEEDDGVQFALAQKLLNQIYGNSWQTPDVIRTLKRTSGSGEKSLTKIRDSSKKSQTQSKPKDNATKGDTILTTATSVTEESVLGDFSMFRRNIVKTNLDSTRLVTPKPKSQKDSNNLKSHCYTEPRRNNTNKQKMSSQLVSSPDFKAPQTEVRRQRAARTSAVTKISANQIRSQNERWRQLIDDSDSDSEGNNASDDEDADKSDDDESWKASDEENRTDTEVSDLEVSPERPKEKAQKIIQTGPIMGVKSFRLVFGDCADEGNLDLSKEEVSILENMPASPPANHDETFASHLNDILKTCRHEPKPKLPSSAQSTKTKRKLFTPMFGHDLEGDDVALIDLVEKENKKILAKERESIIQDNASCPFDAQGRPKKLEIINKHLDAVKTGKPIFQLTPPPKKPQSPLTPQNEARTSRTPKSKTESKPKAYTPTSRKGEPIRLEDITSTPNYKYSFLKSLDVTVSKAFCHPDALYYRDNYRTKKEDLANILYELYNQKLFNNRLNVPLTWNKKLSNTAGRCLNKKKLGIRSSVIELSEKVLTSGDRLRCTLIHELCHAATWIFQGEGGHGRTWKEWASRANSIFPEIPKIGVCHQYEIEYKYTYKCTLCDAKSYAHSKSKKVENIRCSYCHGAIEIFLNKKDKEGNIIPTPVKEPTGFAKFVKDNYKKHKRDDLKHADVMKILSNEFATLKVAGK